MASKADLLRVSDCTESWLLAPELPAPELPHDMHIFGVSGLITTRVVRYSHISNGGYLYNFLNIFY
jgi:hypothetical protein